MEDPTDKATLLAALERGRSEWEALLEQIEPAAMLEPGVEGHWSVKDILAHITPYEHYAAVHVTDMIEHGVAAGPGIAALDQYHNQQLAAYRASHPELSDDLDQLAPDQLNDLFVAELGAAPAEQALAAGRRAYDELYIAVQQISEEALLVPQAQFNGRSFLAMLPFQSYRHYQKHAVFIQQWLEQRAQV